MWLDAKVRSMAVSKTVAFEVDSVYADVSSIVVNKISLENSQAMI